MVRLLWLAGTALVAARAIAPGQPEPLPPAERPGVRLASFVADGVAASADGVTLRGWRLRPSYRHAFGARVGPPTGVELAKVHATWDGPQGPVEVIAEVARLHERGLRFEGCHVQAGGSVVSVDQTLWEVDSGRLLVRSARRPDGRRTLPVALPLRR